MKRGTKWYRKNENEVAKMFGMKATKNSGSDWIEKEDFYNDKIICQLKSTDKESIKVNRLDLEKLESNAIIEHKIPVFTIQFINKDIYIMLKPQDLKTVYQYMYLGKKDDGERIIVKDIKQKKIDKIKSNKKARIKYKENRDKKFLKEDKGIHNFNYL